MLQHAPECLVEGPWTGGKLAHSRTFRGRGCLDTGADEVTTLRKGRNQLEVAALDGGVNAAGSRRSTQSREVAAAGTQHVHHDGASRTATGGGYGVEVGITVGGYPVSPQLIEPVESIEGRLDGVITERLPVGSKEEVGRAVTEPLPLRNVLDDAGFERRIRFDVRSEASQQTEKRSDRRRALARASSVVAPVATQPSKLGTRTMVLRRRGPDSR